MMSYYVSIIGGGASAVALALEFLEHGDPKSKIRIIEKNPAFLAKGMAYTPTSIHYLLNAGVGKMSIRNDDEEDFLKWLLLRDNSFTIDDFAPRSLYGEYLREKLHEFERNHPDRLEIVVGEVVDIEYHQTGDSLIKLKDNLFLQSNYIVLALGNFPGNNFKKIALNALNKVKNAWEVSAANFKDLKHVIIIGSGLTSLDLCWDVYKRQIPIKISMISRRGLMPMPFNSHENSVAKKDLSSPLFNEKHELSLSAIGEKPSLKFLIKAFRAASIHLGEWRPLVRGLRSITPTLWRRFSLKERKAFFPSLCYHLECSTSPRAYNSS
jgi:uncharacterized NAD(P)/FAD-binding protein YdhS